MVLAIYSEKDDCGGSCAKEPDNPHRDLDNPTACHNNGKTHYNPPNRECRDRRDETSYGPLRGSKVDPDGHGSAYPDYCKGHKR